MLRLRWLAAALAATLLVTSVAGVWATWRAASHGFEDILDDDLENQARLLARMLAGRPADTAAPDRLRALLSRLFDEDGDDALWVTVHDLRTRAAVSNLPATLPLADVSAERLRHRDARGREWRGHQQHAGELVVQLLRRGDLARSVRNDVLEDIAMPALAGSAAALLLLALFMWLGVRPLAVLSRQLADRDAGSLAPLTLRLAPREVAELRDAINQLFVRVDGVLARERRFAGDVAHELRTPLTTLKLALSEAEPDLPLLRDEVARMARVVEQLLVLARLEQGHWQQRFRSLALAGVCHSAVDDWQVRARQAGMLVRAGPPLSEVARPGDATLLRVLLDNLIGNALKHCPAGTVVTVALHAATARDGAMLTVSDDGPGIPAALRERMTARFERLDRKSEGLGLGLAICRQIADVHDATLVVEAGADGRGLSVSLRFPAA